MAEYIEREMALKKLCEGCCEYDSENTECSCNEQLALLGIPAADVAPVVHGRWDDYHFVKVDCPKSGFPTVKCSNCEIAFCDLINNHHFMYHYCPNCGARMDGE